MIENNTIHKLRVLHDSSKKQYDGLCNRGSETHYKPKSREISFVHNLFLSYPIILKFYIEHDSITAVLCAKLRNDYTAAKDVIDGRNFARFEF